MEKKQKPLFEALEKLKEELMLMGFISLMLVVFQGSIINMCMPQKWETFMLPCKFDPNARTSSPYRRKLLTETVEQVGSLVHRKLLDPHHMRRLAPTAKECAEVRRAVQLELRMKFCR